MHVKGRTMECEMARVALSALMDDEAAGMDAERARRHLPRCQACRRWYAAAQRIDRAVRIAPVEGEGPDIAEAMLARVPLPRRGRWRLRLQIALLLVALAQLAVGTLALFGPVGMPGGMPVSAHMDHEEAAFNLAFGVALLVIAFDTRRAASQVPMLGSFVLVLGVASALDVTSGAVDWSRIATHAPVAAGLALALALGRSHRFGGDPAGGSAVGALAASSVADGDAGEYGRTGERSESDGHTPPAARREIA
jgi:predicted anti-sigma-YlaC factor YlaD